MKLIRIILVSLLSFCLVCLPIAHAAGLALPSGDLVAPVIEHSPFGKDILPGQSIDVKATVTDNVGVKEVVLFYREINAAEFKRLGMRRDLDSHTYVATLSAIGSPGLEYYIQATDLAGNTLFFGHLFLPLVVTVAPAADVDGRETKIVAAKESKAVSANKEKKSGVSKWVWIGLGVVVAGALAGGGGGGGGGSSDGGGGSDEPAGSSGGLVITGPAP